ncbi:MAG: folate-binding protein YgfZ [Candidatus Kinetoplastibacterium crithidii]|nr:MAG: folate-binding protein YgfZ [Candidatus Kinetoplastibacterium crithidii]
MKTDFSFYTNLNNFSIINITGKDSESFLQRQYTQDIINLSKDKACFSGYCSHNGKVLFTTILWKEFDKNNKNIYCIIKNDIVQYFIKRLQLFILKSDVAIKIHKQELLGIYFAINDRTIFEEKNSIHLNHKEFEISYNEFGTWISAPSNNNDINRFWLITNNISCNKLIRSDIFQIKKTEVLYQNIWHYNDFCSNLPFIGIQNSNLFIAQSINLDLIGAISFNKGCYPGQEVIARIHYKNKIKYRMTLGFCYLNDSIIDKNLIGHDVFNKDNSIECGRIIDHVTLDNKIFILLELDINFHNKNIELYIKYPSQNFDLQNISQIFIK